jgi:hypothetical protein
MHLQRRIDPRRSGADGQDRTLSGMKNRPNTAARGRSQAPLDHLRPGGRSRDDAGAGAAETQPAGSGRTGIEDAESAQPAEPSTPGGADAAADATRGKATSSPAAVATQPHLEGSEQGPA